METSNNIGISVGVSAGVCLAILGLGFLGLKLFKWYPGADPEILNGGCTTLSEPELP